jgi:sigma-54 dependent transcriptional regulator, acetoin dehydrogenase operon transcriptional activator AcoR
MASRAIDDDDTRTDVEPSSEALALVPVLIVIGDANGLGASRTIIRFDRSLEIGRKPDNRADVSWAVDDDRVSRRHAILEVDSRRGWAEIMDLGSRNGTVVDGRALTADPVPLLPGSIIFIGTYAAVFRFVSESDLEAINQDLATPFTPVATASPELARKTQVLRHLSKGDEDLLIIGETGVGKEQFARAVHQSSERWGKFVAINCPALPGSLIESELFGYVKGAHSQASRDKLGLIDEAEHGTLFLDEFAEIPSEVQAKLLRFLEDRDLMALGATKRRQVDVRILAATNRDISAVRQDIAARLGPEPIRLPPLRNHPEDIAALASHFLRDRQGMSVDVAAFQALCLHDWPDNVRGLRKVLGRAAELVAAQGKTVIGIEHLPEGLGRRGRPAPSSSSGASVSAAPEPPRITRRSPRAAPTRTELEALLERHDWVVAQAAREIDRDHAVVWRWIKRYGLDVARARPESP